MVYLAITFVSYSPSLHTHTAYTFGLFLHRCHHHFLLLLLLSSPHSYRAEFSVCHSEFILTNTLLISLLFHFFPSIHRSTPFIHLEKISIFERLWISGIHLILKIIVFVTGWWRKMSSKLVLQSDTIILSSAKL